MCIYFAFLDRVAILMGFLCKIVLPWNSYNHVEWQIFLNNNKIIQPFSYTSQNWEMNRK